ncbi:procathepsin L-like [Diorhabda carinulata]|uniref:procathepsin L-like n=1 Tax=Diorhabda carinulata TaxID=1163345 RepID=UPI0025A23DB5|nr:procathepsin L-like [Diorhabda carinulata]
MYFLFIVLSAIIAANALTDRGNWELFKNQYGKKYLNSLEESRRFVIFQQNLRRIESHNQSPSSFKMGITKFADLTEEEFLDTLTLSKYTKPERPQNIEYIKLDDEVPDEFDWRTKGAVTEVKNQLSCGSCWSFSTTGTLESAYYIHTGNLVSFSEQNLVDCVKVGCNGCLGGWMDKAFDYIKINGIMTESDYPYEAVDQKCKFDPNKSLARVYNYTYIIEGDEVELKKAVAQKGPTAVAIDVTSYFQLYESGVLNDDICQSDILYANHGVVVVGYGTTNGSDYWIVKNSWGADWGMDGYILMSRNRENQCGIATDALYPYF